LAGELNRLHPLLTRCPVCSGATFIERLRCTSCGTAVEGQFSQDWVQALTREQLGFVKVFLSCRGKIKDVEQALGISYPTVVSRLDEVVEAMTGAPPPAPPPDPERGERRKKVLEDLESGAIDAEEAARRLRHS
jgi:hypothetical protein